MTSKRGHARNTYRVITREELIARLDAETRRLLGISVAEFARRYNAGEYDDPDDHPIVRRLMFDIEFLQQNGQLLG